MDKEKIETFLSELHELSKKHGIYLNGCGCCSALYGEDGKALHSHLEHDGEKYEVY